MNYIWPASSIHELEPGTLGKHLETLLFYLLHCRTSLWAPHGFLKEFAVLETPMESILNVRLQFFLSNRIRIV